MTSLFEETGRIYILGAGEIHYLNIEQPIGDFCRARTSLKIIMECMCGALHNYLRMLGRSHNEYQSVNTALD